MKEQGGERLRRTRLVAVLARRLSAGEARGLVAAKRAMERRRLRGKKKREMTRKELPRARPSDFICSKERDTRSEPHRPIFAKVFSG